MLLFSEQILDNLGKSSSPLWKDIASELKNKIFPAAVYTIIKCNRYDCMKTLGLQEKCEPECVFNSEISPQASSDEEIFEVEIFFEISAEEWKQLLNVEGLQHNWTDIFFEKLTSSL